MFLSVSRQTMSDENYNKIVRGCKKRWIVNKKETVAGFTQLCDVGTKFGGALRWNSRPFVAHEDRDRSCSPGTTHEHGTLHRTEQFNWIEIASGWIYVHKYINRYSVSEMEQFSTSSKSILITLSIYQIYNSTSWNDNAGNIRLWDS